MRTKRIESTPLTENMRVRILFCFIIFFVFRTDDNFISKSLHFPNTLGLYQRNQRKKGSNLSILSCVPFTFLTFPYENCFSLYLIFKTCINYCFFIIKCFYFLISKKGVAHMRDPFAIIFIISKAYFSTSFHDSVPIYPRSASAESGFVK